MVVDFCGVGFNTHSAIKGIMEIWKSLIGYEDLYEVSDQGRVRSVNRVLQGRCDKDGYRVFTLTAGGKKTKKAHRLVLEAFVGLCPEGMECCHNDGDPSNNHLHNLRWDTRKANRADRRQHGTATATSGETHPMAKLQQCDVNRIRALSLQGVRQHLLAKEFRVSSANISLIVNGRRWK